MITINNVNILHPGVPSYFLLSSKGTFDKFSMYFVARVSGSCIHHSRLAFTKCVRTTYCFHFEAVCTFTRALVCHALTATLATFVDSCLQITILINTISAHFGSKSVILEIDRQKSLSNQKSPTKAWIQIQIQSV